MYFETRLKLFVLIVVFAVCLPLDAKTHSYEPQVYWREFSSHMEPALTIRAGDHVTTSCVDSNGVDKSGKRVTLPYNPLTGPFVVENAEPGDTLVVRIEGIRLNRPTGIGSSRISPEVVTPEYLTKSDTLSRSLSWVFDLEGLTGKIDEKHELLESYSVPLRPFLGTIGVAPAARESAYSQLMGRMGFSASSITADSHGGNIDYNRFLEGTVLYFPVFVPGAYLFMGDGHAAQGDGETSGGAIETSLEVKFSVDIRKGERIPAVRGESEDFYMALGTGRPLEQALKNATVNMLGWLSNGFGLSEEEAHVLLGTSVDYDITVAVTPRYVISCKIPKRILEGLK